MLARLLHPLDRRQQTLLLCLMSFGGQQADELLALLPDDDVGPMREKADKLKEIPTDKRVPLMVRQLKQLMSFRGNKGLEGVDPSWLLAGFKGESPRTVAIVLMHMPSSVSRQIVSRLPDDVRQAMPSRKDLQAVPMELIKLVRNRFDAKFAAMPQAGPMEAFGFRELVLLNARELVAVIRKLGLEELAQAFLAVGKRALAAFLSRLPPDNAEELVAAVKRAAAGDAMDAKDAQAFLGRHLKNFNNVDELFQKAGLFRLARAVQVDDRMFLRQLSQRFPRAHGRLLADYLSKVREREPLPDEQLARLRDSIVDHVRDLSLRGKIDASYGAAPVQYEGR
jgi:flagellar motor switch protein FliG